MDYVWIDSIESKVTTVKFRRASTGVLGKFIYEEDTHPYNKMSYRKHVMIMCKSICSIGNCCSNDVIYKITDIC